MTSRPHTLGLTASRWHAHSSRCVKERCSLQKAGAQDTRNLGSQVYAESAQAGYTVSMNSWTLLTSLTINVPFQFSGLEKL